jgi:hypothetical protein
MMETNITPLPSASEWARAMDRYLEKKAASDHYDRTVFTPAFDREYAYREKHGLNPGPRWLERREAFIVQHGKDWQVPDIVTEIHETLVEAACDAEDALMRLPAPDLEALHFKLSKLIDIEDGDCTSSWSADYARPALMDCHRLLIAPARCPSEPRKAA